MKFDKDSLLLYAVTDRAWLYGDTLDHQVELTLKGGATCIQLREKSLDKDSFLKEASSIKKLCASFSVPFIIDDDVEIAKACDADGIHVGQHDLEAGRVRDIIGPDKILGVSCQTVKQAILAQKKGADYLGVGAVFATATKPDADTVSFETLKDICASVSIPVVAIGGIDANNILQLSGSGIDGVAIVSAIFAQKNIEKATKKLLTLSERMMKS